MKVKVKKLRELNKTLEGLGKHIALNLIIFKNKRIIKPLIDEADEMEKLFADEYVKLHRDAHLTEINKELEKDDYKTYTEDQKQQLITYNLMYNYSSFLSGKEEYIALLEKEVDVDFHTFDISFIESKGIELTLAELESLDKFILI